MEQACCMDKEEPSQPPSSEVEEDVSGRSLLDKVRDIFGIRATPDTTEELEHEIQELLEEGEEQGLISVHEERLITSIFNFRETAASEIMTPAAEIVAAEQSVPVTELIKIVTEEGYTRIPIYADTFDHVLGVIHAKDLLKVCGCDEEGEMEIAKFIKPVSFIAESKPITELLREFQSQKTHMAMVVDEFGSVRGLITLEDVIEEIVGEIDDEYDTDEGFLRVVDENTIIVDAKIDIEEVERHFQVELPEGPYESIGGFIIQRLGKVPAAGATLQEGELTFRILAADARHIKTVSINRGL